MTIRPTITDAPTSTDDRFLSAIDEALAEVRAEVVRAMDRFPAFASPHEGYAVLLEEVDELWNEVKASDNVALALMETVQVAAMAVRFAVDVRDLRNRGEVAA